MPWFERQPYIIYSLCLGHSWCWASCRCALPTPFSFAVLSDALSHCESAPESQASVCGHLLDWLGGWKARLEIWDHMIHMYMCTCKNTYCAWSLTDTLAEMAHSNLAKQWEAVGEIRDKARQLDLAPSLDIIWDPTLHIPSGYLT